MRRPVGKTTVWRRQELVRLGVILFDWHTLVLHCPPLWLTYPGVTLPSIMTDVPWCYSAPPLWLMYPCVTLPSLVTIWHTLQLHCPPSRLSDTPWRYTAFHCNWHTLQLHCPPLSPYDTPWRYTALYCDFFTHLGVTLHSTVTIWHILASHCPALRLTYLARVHTWAPSVASILVSSWILTSHEAHRVTSGRITHSTIFYTCPKTHDTKRQVKSWMTVLGTT